METKKFAVIGHPIGHTMSPFIHTRLFELQGVKAEYTKLDIAPENLEYEFKNTLSKLDGFNITIPHKQAVIPFLDEIDAKAEMYGSVNTVSNKNGISKGYTTDPDGFLKALDAAGIMLNGRIVIIGCGGVARTMAYEVVLKKQPLLFAVRKEDLKMKFEEALKVMKSGIKVKLPSWGGYWYWNPKKETIIMHTKDGNEMDIRETQVVEYTVGNILSDEWIAADESNCPQLGGEAAFSFGEAIKYLKRGFKVARKGWNGKKQYIQLATGISYRTADDQIVNCEHDAIGNMAVAFVGTSGVQMGWLASQADMLAEDWIFAEA